MKGFELSSVNKRRYNEMLNANFGLAARGQGRHSTQCTPDRFGKASTRRGAVAVFGLFLTMALIVLVAVTLDFGNIRVAQSEMRRAADAAAMAACWEMYDAQSQQTESGYWSLHTAAWNGANEISDHNVVGDGTPQISFVDVQVGQYDALNQEFNVWSADKNAVRVTLRRQNRFNGELPLFFGSLTGKDTQSLQTTATAAMFSQIVGFNQPKDGKTLDILPIALDLPSWEAAVKGVSGDSYAFDGNVRNGSDGICEANLYPKGTGAPGNRGTVDIGGANNSTSDLCRQILHGVSEQDMADLGKPLVLDENRELEVNGDTGISAGIKDELTTLVGKTRIIPIFTKVQGNGNNAMFTIVKFEGVRILDVKLTGKKNQKRVIIQPAKVMARDTVIDYAGTTYSSHLVTPVMLVE